MNKKTFLGNLRKRLNVLSKDEVDDNLNVSRTKNADKLKVKSVYKLILNGLRKREFYNYDNINDVTLTIKLSTDTKNKIDEKEKNESCFGYENCTCDNEGVCSGYNVTVQTRQLEKSGRMQKFYLFFILI